MFKNNYSNLKTPIMSTKLAYGTINYAVNIKCLGWTLTKLKIKLKFCISRVVCVTHSVLCFSPFICHSTGVALRLIVVPACTAHYEYLTSFSFKVSYLQRKTKHFFWHSGPLNWLRIGFTYIIKNECCYPIKWTTPKKGTIQPLV